MFRKHNKGKEKIKILFRKLKKVVDKAYRL
jgi:hypothetical protein